MILSDSKKNIFFTKCNNFLEFEKIFKVMAI